MYLADLSKSFWRYRSVLVNENSLLNSARELLIRYAKLLDAALDLMNDNLVLSLDRLHRPALYFCGESPLSVSITSVGAEEVLSFVSRLSHGSCN